MTCDDCGHDIYVTDTSLDAIFGKDCEFLCSRCVGARLRAGAEVETQQAADPRFQALVDAIGQDGLIEHLKNEKEPKARVAMRVGKGHPCSPVRVAFFLSEGERRLDGNALLRLLS